MLQRDRHLCQECKRQGRVRVGDQVDHILPIAERPELQWDESNLQTLCRACHGRKTLAELRARGPAGG